MAAQVAIACGLDPEVAADIVAAGRGRALTLGAFVIAGELVWTAVVSEPENGARVQSSSVEAFEGARITVADCEQFRVDAVYVPDSLRLLVRNHGGGQVEFEPVGYPHRVWLSRGDPAELGVVAGHHEAGLRVNGVAVRVHLATLHSLDEGMVRMTTQAVIG